MQRVDSATVSRNEFTPTRKKRASLARNVLGRDQEGKAREMCNCKWDKPINWGNGAIMRATDDGLDLQGANLNNEITRTRPVRSHSLS